MLILNSLVRPDNNNIIIHFGYKWVCIIMCSKFGDDLLHRKSCRLGHR